MNLAVIGSGGREHALCYKLKQSPKIKKLICIPGNAGTQKLAKNINEDILDFATEDLSCCKLLMDNNYSIWVNTNIILGFETKQII